MKEETEHKQNTDYPSLFSSLLQAHPNDLQEIIKKYSNLQQGAPAVSNGFGKPLWEIDAGIPFIGSAVHEDMTKASVTLSNILDRPFDYEQDEGFIHGVFFNDDPENLLCPECSVFNLRKFDKRWGITFGERFQSAKQKVKRQQTQGSPSLFNISDGLLERSHFGDLQFLHSMASTDSETAGETLDKMLAWAEFTYKVAIGEIPQKTKLNTIPIESVRNLFVGNLKLEEMTIEELFRGGEFARRVAMGSLLHMIQDSYAPGHTEREVLDYTAENGEKIFKRSFIKEFHFYANQDEDLHKQDDKWPDGLDKINPIGDLNPISMGAKILQFMCPKNGKSAPWPDVETYLQEVVLSVPDRTIMASPGNKYRKT
ncbi:MAG: hypothetical protein WCI11_15960 [Candidatus Methylumidiphilus sp.]